MTLPIQLYVGTSSSGTGISGLEMVFAEIVGLFVGGDTYA